jgi:hypothetical protein
MDDLDDSLECRLRLVIEVLGQSVDDIVAVREEQTTVPPVDYGEETRRLNAHVSRLHAALAEQTEIARREANAREKLEARNASMQVEMRDMRASQKFDLAECRAQIDRLTASLEDTELALAIAETRAPSAPTPVVPIAQESRSRKGKRRHRRGLANGANWSKDANDANDASGANWANDGAVVTKKENEKENEKEEKEFEACVYECSVRISASIAEMEPRALTDDDVLVMRTASDVHCTTSVLDPRGILVGLMHVMCPFAAMREWTANAKNEEYASAVREIREDATSKEARGAFARAMVELAQHDPVGKRILDRGAGRPGPVREVTGAARRCKLSATPDEMLAWLVRARARTLRQLEAQKAPKAPATNV